MKPITKITKILSSMPETKVFFDLTNVSLLRISQEKMHWRLKISNCSPHTETWALQTAWGNKSSCQPLITHLPRETTLPWDGSFALGPITLYPMQERVIEVFSSMPSEFKVHGPLELNWQFFFDQDFGSIQISQVNQL
jgi:hypothetical protein